MKPLARLGLRRLTGPKVPKKSRLSGMGSVALARGTRTGSSGLSALGTALLVVGAARRRKKRGELIYRAKLKPGQALRLRVTRDGD